MENSDRELTQLENELFSKMVQIKKYLIIPKYHPKRVEPGIGFELNVESKWSKYVGETLFINQLMLQDTAYRKAIFWREAFLLFVPEKERNNWWVRLLADAYPLSTRLGSKVLQKWEKLIRKVSSDYNDIIDQLKQVIASLGSKGLVKILNDTLYQELVRKEEKIEVGVKIKEQKPLNPHEFKIILSDIYFDSVAISENSIDILEKALIKQTIRPKILGQFSTKHTTTISKTIKKLLSMNVLEHSYRANFSAMGLSQYLVLLVCSKEQSAFFKHPPKNPFLLSHKFNCLNICIITQYYVAPNDKRFYQLLTQYGNELKNQNRIFEFYAFKIKSAFRSYTFKYFNPKTKLQSIDFNSLTVDSGLFSSTIKEYDKSSAGNILIPSRVFKSKKADLDLIDLRIINQFLLGNDARRVIQKNIRKDMNETVQRIRRLFDIGLLYEAVSAVLPYSDSDTTFYIQKETSKKKDKISIQEHLTRFVQYLPNAYFGEIEGSYDGLILRTFLPHKTAMEIADFFTWYLPENLDSQILLGQSNFQKYRSQIEEKTWHEGNWIINEEDFKF